MKHISLKLLMITSLLLLASGFIYGQDDGLNLPAELYILLNEGRIERYGLGAAGVQTVTPDEVFIIDFSIAPDGETLAYRTEDGLTLASLADATIAPSLIDPAADVPPLRRSAPTLAWSPLGDMVVMTTGYGLRAVSLAADPPVFFDITVTSLLGLSWSPQGTYLAAEAEDNFWWIYRRDGSVFSLAGALPSSYGTAWLDDGRLIFAPEEGGLLLLDLNNGNAQSQLRDASTIYRQPAVRTDGTIAVFTRQPEAIPTTGTLERIQINGGTISTVSTGSESVELEGTRWAPGGQLLVASSMGAIALVLPEIGLEYPLPIENVVAYGWGTVPPQTVEGLAMTADAYFIAPDSLGIDQVWRLPADGSPPARLTRAESPVTAYAIAEDALVFVSEETLWRQPFAREGEPEGLIAAESVAHLEISPDGAAVYYDTPAGIFLFRTEASSPDLIFPNETRGRQFSQPQLSLSGELLLLHDQPAEQYAVLNLVTGNINELDMTLDGAVWLDDGRILAYRNTGTGLQTSAELLLINPTEGQPRTLFQLEGIRIAAVAATGLDQVGALLLGPDYLRPRPTRLVQIDLSAGDGSPTARWTGFLPRPVLAPDGGVVAGLPGDSQSALRLFDGSRGALIQLGFPLGVKDFRWVTFR